MEFLALEPHAAEAVFAVKEKLAVLTVAARADVVGKIAVIGIQAERKTFVAKFGAVREGEIHGVFRADDILSVETILRVIGVKSHIAVFAVIHVIAHAILAICEMRRAPWRLQLDGLKTLFIEFAHFFEVFLSRQRFVKKIILLLPKPGAAETILAADAVIAIRAIRTIFKVLGISAIIAMINVNALKTDFARIAVIAIHAIARIQDDTAVEAVFIKIGRKEKIAVLIFIRMGAVV